MSTSTVYSNNSGFDSSIVINGPVQTLNRPVHIDAGDILHRAAGDINRHFIVPHRLSPIYTGRQELLSRLKDSLCPGPNRDASGRDAESRIAVVYGLGGSGKTQLCVKLSNDVQQKFGGVFWVDLSSDITARHGLESILRCLNKRESSNLANDARFALASWPLPWLLVLDNANDPRLDVRQYLPPGHCGSVLVISTNTSLLHLAPEASFSVGELEDTDASTLLAKAGRLDMRQDQARALVQKVTAKLGNLPLGIVQAGSCIVSRRLSLQDFDLLLTQTKNEILETTKAGVVGEDHLPIYATLDISLESIHEFLNEELREDALELLGLLSQMSCQGVSADLFSWAWTALTKLSAHDRASILIPRILQPAADSNNDVPWDTTRFWRAVDCLEFFSLIQEGESSQLGRLLLMHELVHSWARYRLRSDQEKEEKSRMLVWTMIGLIRPRAAGMVELSLFVQLRCSLLLEVDNSCAEELETSLGDSIGRLRCSYGDLGDLIGLQVASLVACVMPKMAESHIQALYEHILATRNGDSEATTAALEAMRTCKEALHDWKGMHELDEKLLATRKRTLGPLHVSTMDVQLRLVDHLSRKGEHRAAKRKLTQIVVDQENIQGGGTEQVAAFRFDVRHCIDRLQCTDEDDTINDEPVMQPSAALYPDMIYPEDLTKDLVHINYCLKNHMLSEASATAWAAYEKSCKLLGYDHHMTVRFFGLCLGQWRRFEVTNSLSSRLTSVKATCEAVHGCSTSSGVMALTQQLGPDHPLTLTTALEVVMCQTEIPGEGFESRVLLLQRTRQTLLDSKQRYYPSMYEYLRVVTAVAYLVTGNSTETNSKALSKELRETAHDDLAQSLAEMRERLCCCHPHTVMLAALIGDVLGTRGEYDNACKMIAQALLTVEINRRSFDRVCGIWGKLNNEIPRRLYVNTQSAAANGDEKAGQVLRQLVVRSCQRDQFRTESQLLHFEVTPDTNALAFLLYGYQLGTLPIDCEAMEDLVEYWAYRARAEEHSMEQVRKQARPDVAKSSTDLIWLIETFDAVCNPPNYRDIGSDWKSDMLVLADLRDTLALMRIKQWSRTDHAALRELHLLRRQYIYLKDLEKQLEMEQTLTMLCDDKGVCSYSPCRIRHRDRVDRLEDKIDDREWRERGFQRAMAEMTKFPVKCVLFIASGFVWESWLDDESQRSDPLKILRDSAGDARDWLYKSPVYVQSSRWARVLLKTRPKIKTA